MPDVTVVDLGPQTSTSVTSLGDTEITAGVELAGGPIVGSSRPIVGVGSTDPAGEPGDNYGSTLNDTALWYDTTTEAVAPYAGTWRRWTGNSWAPPLPPPDTAFNPATLGAVLWLRAEGQAATDGATVTTWTADTGPDVTAPSAAPVYRPTGLDGLPGIAFSSGRWFATQDAAMNLGEEFTVATVLKTLPGNADGMTWMFGNEASQRRRALWCSGTSAVNFSGYDANVITSATTSTRCLLVMRRKAGVISIRKNGVQVGFGNPGLSAYTYAGFGVGANVSGSEAYTGVMGCLAAFSRALTDAELATLETGLIGDYEIS